MPVLNLSSGLLSVCCLVAACFCFLVVKIVTVIRAKTRTTSTKQSAKNPSVSLPSSALSIWLRPFWRNKLNDQPQNPKSEMSPESIEVRIWAFVVVMVTLVLVFIVAMLLYSVTFVTQPIKSMAPIDQAYTKMLNDIVLLIVGGIGGIMTKRVTKAAANAFGTPPTPSQPPMLYSAQPMGQSMGYGQPSYPQSMMPTNTWTSPAGSPNFNWMNFNNAELDESWTPGPPPTTPPDYLDPSREEIALERAQARSET